MTLISTEFTNISEVNKEREASRKGIAAGASTLMGVVGGAATLFFAGPLVATAIGASVGGAIYKFGTASDRDENRKKLASINTSDRNKISYKGIIEYD